MIRDDLRILAFQPVQLTLADIGPFRGTPYSIDFTDAENQPCNFYLLMSENGRGKTTILHVLCGLITVLGANCSSIGHEDLDFNEGKAQLDIRTTYRRHGKSETILISVFYNRAERTLLHGWSPNAIADVDVERAVTIQIRKGVSGFEAITRDESAKELLAVIREAQSDPSYVPDGFGLSNLEMPTVLLFSAYRDVPSIRDLSRTIEAPEHWRYRITHNFAPHGQHWTDSLDNLFVWLTWLGEERFEQARDLINRYVFEGSTKAIHSVRRNPPEIIVIADGHKHRLDQLSSGEKNLAYLFARIGAHMTGNTIVLIDEPEIHLHPRWQRRLMRHFRDFLKAQSGVTIIAATHSLDMLDAFAFERNEVGLRKGGNIIKDGIAGE